MALDLSLDEARGKAWVQEVNGEIELVQQLIDSVDAFMAELNEESDPVMSILRNASEKFNSYGEVLKKSFSSAVSGFQNALSELLKRQADILEKGAEYVSAQGGN